jgi:hypothetical protein
MNDNFPWSLCVHGLHHRGGNAERTGEHWRGEHQN